MGTFKAVVVEKGEGGQSVVLKDFDENDLGRFFAEAGFADVTVDLGNDEHEVGAERYLNQVGAPGRPTLLEHWRNDFALDDVERLVDFLRGRTIPVRDPHAFLTARKP